jgi:4-hydroxy-tetrahydrodipicolinate synthase
MDFEGNLVALVTPFRDGRVDADALGRLVEWTVRGGIAGLVPCGTTGESPTLSHQEHDEVVARTCELAAGRVPVVAGTGSNATAEAVRLTRAAAAAGAAAVLSVTPYYNRPSQEGLYRHFAAVAEASELPVVLYDIPGRTGVALEAATIARLAAHPNIRAIKEATGRVENVSRIRGLCDLAVLAGDDALALPMIALGARGVISVLSNLLPARVTELCDHALHGRLEAARALHDRLFPLMRALFVDTNPVPVKTALAGLGLIEPDLRLPLCPMGETALGALREALSPFRPELPSRSTP